MKVLIVEDNALTRFTIRSLVEKMKFEVVGEEDTVDSAVKAVKQLKPDMVLLDLILPGAKSGIEAIDEIKVVDPNIKVVVITAIEQTEIDKTIAEKGVDAVLKKPFSFDEFQKTIERTIKSGK